MHSDSPWNYDLPKTGGSIRIDWLDLMGGGLLDATKTCPVSNFGFSGDRKWHGLGHKPQGIN